ncbi:hypothetical protein N7475_000860 [Penicillium sp. IBT 31633x]|nr:hypothetical protein N7475_000860 [Penicillium sp. IBT 31633x]
MENFELLGNHSFPLNSPQSSDPLFHVCWRRQSCSSCLTGDVACSWCAITSTCVPNPSRVPIFAPLGSSNICPLGSKERWEMRASPFGCNASTVTVLSVIVAVLGTLAFGGTMAGLVWLVRRTRRHWKETEYQRIESEEEGSSGWQAWDSRLASLVGLLPYWGQTRYPTEVMDGEDEAESRPLLE